MKLDTLLLGAIEYEEEDIVTFPQGLPSFEEERSFLLLPLEGSDGELLCLQSVSVPSLSFILMNPFSLLPSYTPLLREDERGLLGVQQDRELCFYVLCAMKRPASDSTINLKCPIALNPGHRIAYQVILDTDIYHMRHPLSEFAHSKGEAESC